MEYQKSNSELRISILERLSAPIFRQYGQVATFVPKLAQIWILRSKYQNLSLHLQPAPFRYYVHQFSNKANNFHFFGATFSKNDFCCRNFKNLSLDLELASWRYYVNQFSGKTDNFEFVCLNLSKKLILGWRYQKSKSQIVIRTLEILCAPIFRQKGQL